MDSDDAVALLKAAIPREPGVWADLGAGTGTFTRALASLLPGGRVYAVDQNARSLSKPNNHRQRGAATIIPVVADFTRPLDLPERSEEHTSELQSRPHLVCRLLLEKKKRPIWHSVL